MCKFKSLIALFVFGLCLVMCLGGQAEDDDESGEAIINAVEVCTSGDVYVGGDFNSAGGVEANNIARWDGEEWHSLGEGTDDIVYAINYSGPLGDGNLYIGGRFTTAGNTDANSVAMWDGEEWNELGEGIEDGYVTDIDNASDKIYFGGNFESAGGLSANNIAMWNCNSNEWHALGQGIEDTGGPDISHISSIREEGFIYVVGQFDRAGGEEISDIAYWNSSEEEWNDLFVDYSITLMFSAIAVDQSDLYVGGKFNSLHADGDYLPDVNKIFKAESWGASTYALGDGLQGGESILGVQTLEFDDADRLYIGGDFLLADGMTANNIAMYDGYQYNTLGSGVREGGRVTEVKDIAIDDHRIYVGGSFTIAGEVSANYIAKWDASINSWKQLGEGVSRDELPEGEEEYDIELTANPQEGGEVDGAGTYEEGEEVTIEADPAEECEFVNWTEDGTSISTNSEYTFEVEEDRELVANFSKKDPRIETNRHSGSHRYETAVEISQASFPDNAEAAVLARGDDFPDALAGVPLAYAKDGPLLLTSSARLHSDTASEIDRLLAEGDTVYVLGGKAAISEEVKNELEEDGYAVKRLAGANRYETAIAIAEELPGNPEEGFLTTGAGFADAVAASGVAASQGAPILLTHPEELSEDTAEYIEDNQLSDIHVIGGEAVVSPEVKAEAGSDSRIAGANRWETAVEVAEEFFTSPNTAALATGDDFPDALSGGVYAAIQDAPMLLSAQDELPGEVGDYFNQEEAISKVAVFGGEAVVSEEVLRTIEFIE